MTQIFSFSLIIWILIDRFKGMWENSKYKSYITSGVALLLGAAVSIVYQLDIVVALGLSETASTLGIVLTALAMMGGSSCIAEIMEKISFKQMPNMLVISDDYEEKEDEEDVADSD